MKRICNKKSIFQIFIFFIVFGIYSCNNAGSVTTKDYSNISAQLSNEKPYIVMLSVDGFRWDYPDSTETPNLDYIERKGVKAKSLKPCFPSKTFPNHYSIATGLYPDHHGIIFNNFYDPEMDKYYSISKRKSVRNPDFYGGEPIWNTAEKQGVKAGSYFWVGSEAPVQGIIQTHSKEYRHNFPFEQRIDSVIAWLTLPVAVRPHLITWYIHEPDMCGHIYGPDSKETREMNTYLDSLIGVFIRKVEKLPHSDKINIIVTSDHGMCNVSADRRIIFSDYVKQKWFDIIEGSNPVFNLKPKEKYYDTVYSILKKVPHIKVWKPAEVPERLHYGTNPRVLDIIVVADSAWSIGWKHSRYAEKGTHGYDNNRV
jgi:alkaline phosphatase D